jgi:Mn2+/Fe2+ NRAMP family transporter
VKNFLEIFLGILTAMGGFVEIGELVFSVNAGAKFGYSLLWVSLLGTVGIIVYGEMAGRIAAVTRQPVFYVIRERVGFNLALGTLLAANLVSLLTCAAEIGGIAIILRLLFGGPYRGLILLGFLFLLLSVWFLPFEWIERFYGLFGLLMVVFMASAYALHPDWRQVALSFIPNVPALESRSEYFSYAYFVVALLSSIMLPYETYFYASGAIEDRWEPKEVKMNRVIVLIGFILGSLLAVGLIIIGARLFLPTKLEPDLPGAAALGPALNFGKFGLIVALLGMFFAFSGAAVENALTGAYNLAQFLGWPWGKFRKPAGAPRFTLAWIGMFVLALLIIITGVDPVQVVEYSIIFSVIILPLTYLPMLMAASDKALMGPFVNGWLAKTLGWFYLIVICLAALAAVPLLLITHGGKG